MNRAIALNQELVLLCAEQAQLREGQFSSKLQRYFARAEHSRRPRTGRTAQLQEYFRTNSGDWPIAAILRQHQTNDCKRRYWLRADPVHISPDLSTARLLACEQFGLSESEAEHFFQTLQPIVEQAGYLLSRSDSNTWYISAPQQLTATLFAEPSQAMGDNIMNHLPSGEGAAAWIRLMNETQIVLHADPINRQRRAQAKLPINSLWFWGAGYYPSRIHTALLRIISNADDLSAFASATNTPLIERFSTEQLRAGTLIDLRSIISKGQLGQEFIIPAISELDRGLFKRLRIDFMDGAQFCITASQAWYFWRNRRTSFNL